MFTDYPLGHTAGPPHEPQTQLSIVRSALDAAYSIDVPGTIIPLEHQWSVPWKDEARALVDHRSTRHDSPQYQTDADRLAAIERHGEEAACAVCS